jgi:hypothetical protein
MAAKLDRAKAQEAVDAIKQHGTLHAAAKAMNLNRDSLRGRLQRAVEFGLMEPIEFKANPSRWRPFDEVVEARKREFERVKAHGGGRSVQEVHIRNPGPFMIVAIGDPHLDNPGADLIAFERWCDVLDATKNVFGFALGDWLDNWVRVLGHLYATAETTAPEGWILLEGYLEKYAKHFIGSVSGNHDDWSGHSDPLGMLMAKHKVPHRSVALRLGINTPDGERITLGARHRFTGNSQWNPAHAVMKAAKLGWRDTILVGGDKHISGDGLVRCPDTGRLTWCYQVAAFKRFDDYGEQLGLMDQHVSPAVAFIVDPSRAEDDPQLVVAMHDPEAAVEYLTVLRAK